MISHYHFFIVIAMVTPLQPPLFPPLPWPPLLELPPPSFRGSVWLLIIMSCFIANLHPFLNKSIPLGPPPCPPFFFPKLDLPLPLPPFSSPTPSFMLLVTGNTPLKISIYKINPIYLLHNSVFRAP